MLDDSKYNFYTLLFINKDIEMKYNIYIFKHDKTAFQFGLFLGILMYGGFIILDYWVLPNDFKMMFISMDNCCSFIFYYWNN
jgi:hypothetical protein